MIVLMYHELDKEGDKFSVNLSDFEEQIKYFHDNNIDITITFDDGEASNYLALPILEKYGYKAIFFLIPYHLNHEHSLSDEKVKELLSKGMTIGSHSFNHKDLTLLSEEDIETELKESKELIESRFGVEIKYFSIPFGQYNDKIIEIAKKVGYERVFTSNWGKDNGEFLVNRICVKQGDSAEDILAKVK